MNTDDNYSSDDNVGPSRPRPPQNRPRTPPATTVDTSQPNAKRLMRAVLHSVQPNLNSPTTASVLLNNEMPPRPGYSLPPDFGPVYAAGTTTVTDGTGRVIPVNGPYINDPAAFQGGSFVYVDPDNKVVVQLLQGTNTQLPSSASRVISKHHHTGGLDTDGNPAPSQVDLVSHVTGILPKPHYPQIPAGTTPNVLSSSLTPDHIGYPIFDETVNFIVDDVGTTDSGWLVGLRVFAIPQGSVPDLNHGKGRVLADVLPAQDPDAGSSPPHASYSTYIGGLAAGVVYNIYVCYFDIFGRESAYTLLGTTGNYPLTVTNLPGVGTLPNVSFVDRYYPMVGLASYTCAVDVTVDYTNSTAYDWLENIVLYADVWDEGSGQPVPYTGKYANINIGDVNPNPIYAPGFTPFLRGFNSSRYTTNPYAQYKLLFDGLQLGDIAANPNYVYRLYIAFQALNGEISTPQALCITDNHPVQSFEKKHFIQMPTGTTLSAYGVTLSTDNSAQADGGQVSITINDLRYNDAAGSHYLNSDTQWCYGVVFRAHVLYKSRTLGFPGSGGTSFYFAAAQAEVEKIIPAVGGGGSSYTAQLPSLRKGEAYSIQVDAIDYRGQNTGGVVLGQTTTIGDFPSSITPYVPNFQFFWQSQLNGNRACLFSFNCDTDTYHTTVSNVGVQISQYGGGVLGTWTSHVTPNNFYSGMIPNIPPGINVIASIYYISKANTISNFATTSYVTVP